MPYDFSTDTRPSLPLASIYVSPDRSRKDFSGLADLQKNILEVGLIQPIVVDEYHDPLNPQFTHKLLAGETRYRAFLITPEAGGKIPYTLRKDCSPTLQKEIELYENLYRKDLSWQEKINNMHDLEVLKRDQLGNKTKENPDGWDFKETAKITGLDKSDVGKQVRFAKLLKTRPDIAARVAPVPLNVAMRMSEAILESENAERLHTSGAVTHTHELVNTDAITFLATLPNDSVDLYLTDGPFGMETLESRRGEDTSDSTSVQSYQSQLKPNDNSTRESVLSLYSKVIPEMYRTLKPGRHFYFFFELELLGDLTPLFLTSGLSPSYPILIWDKGRTTTIFRGYNYSSSYEAILYGWKPPLPSDSPRRLSDSSGSILRFPIIHASKKSHVFEKPIELLASLIKRSTNVGDLVVDPFAGSASTLVAAKQTARRAKGCEIDREHFLTAQTRLLSEVTLSVPPVATTATI